MTAPATATPDPTTEKPPQPKRWIPLSLRMIVAMLVILGVAVAWPCVKGFRQFVAVQEMERQGASIDWRAGIIPPGPVWLRDLVGWDRMRISDEVIGLTFYRQTDDAMLRQIRGLTALKELTIHNKQVTDPRLAEEMTELTA